MDESIKVAFQKVKQDIDTLHNKLESLTQIFQQNQEQFFKINSILEELTSKIVSKKENISSLTHPAHNSNISACDAFNPANKHLISPQKEHFIPFSTGNEGVPADRQTDQQTDQQTERVSFNQAIDLLGSLDGLKAEIKNKFKKITDQEFLVFSTIYQIEEERGYADYKVLSQKLNLTESSIRDYVGKLIQKGIPLNKSKVNNKVIQLSVSDKLRKIAPLSILFQLRTM